MGTLTPRQQQVLALIATGRTYADIAGELGIGEQTVKNHAYRSFSALDVSGAIQAFVKLGWLRPAPVSTTRLNAWDDADRSQA